LKEKNDFTVEQLIKVWKTFADNIDAPQLRVALSHREPVLKENFVVKYSLDNEQLIERIEHLLKPKLQGALRTNLHNSYIEINFVIASSTDVLKDKPRMPEDQWKAMVEKNPALADFKQKFGLDFDSSIN
jgi:hypothetical protein